MEFLRECIVIAGRANGGHILGKTRDRNYRPTLKVVRDIVNGLEVAYIIDLRTKYLEGMNEKGVGVINAALLVSEDEKAASKYWQRQKKGKGTSNDGPRILHALGMPTLQKCIKSLIGYDSGIKGHTLVGSPKSLYAIELTSKNNPVVKRLDPSTGYDVRTNHGVEHPDAGYTPTRHPDDYLSSKMRKANAEVAISDIDNPDELLPALADQHFEPDSNLNMLRRTDDMRSSSQVLMNLEDLEMVCYYFPDECDFMGIEDKTPPDYDPKINLRIVKYNES